MEMLKSILGFDFWPVSGLFFLALVAALVAVLVVYFFWKREIVTLEQARSLLGKADETKSVESTALVVREEYHLAVISESHKHRAPRWLYVAVKAMIIFGVMASLVYFAYVLAYSKEWLGPTVRQVLPFFWILPAAAAVILLIFVLPKFSKPDRAMILSVVFASLFVFMLWMDWRVGSIIALLAAWRALRVGGFLRRNKALTPSLILAPGASTIWLILGFIFAAAR